MHRADGEDVVQEGYLAVIITLTVQGIQALADRASTELPNDIAFEEIPFPFDALVFMLPKGIVRHPTEGDCPFLVLSRTSKGQTLSLPIPEVDFEVTAEEDAVLVTTYMPEAPLNITYFESVPLIR